MGVAWLALVLVATPASQPLERALTATSQAHHLPAGVAVVVKDGRVVWSQAFGSRGESPEDRVQVDDALDIGSITKTFTALAILQLRDAGKLSLDDEVTSWVPEARLTKASWSDREPTLRDLLLHRSGFPRDGHFDTPNDRRKTERRLAQDLRVQLESAPGEKEVYSNLGYAVLGLVVQRASDQPYREYMNEHLLTPLGIVPCWQEADVPTDRRVLGRTQKASDPQAPWELRSQPMDPNQLGAAGSMCMSAPELAQLVLLELGQLPNPPLARASVVESQKPGAPDTSTGFGVSLLPMAGVGQVVWKNGAVSGFTASMMADPARRVGVALLVAASGCETDAAAGDLMRAAVRAR